METAINWLIVLQKGRHRLGNVGINFGQLLVDDGGYGNLSLRQGAQRILNIAEIVLQTVLVDDNLLILWILHIHRTENRYKRLLVERKLHKVLEQKAYLLWILGKFLLFNVHLGLSQLFRKLVQLVSCRLLRLGSILFLALFKAVFCLLLLLFYLVLKLLVSLEFRWIIEWFIVLLYLLNILFQLLELLRKLLLLWQILLWIILFLWQFLLFFGQILSLVHSLLHLLLQLKSLHQFNVLVKLLLKVLVLQFHILQFFLHLLLVHLVHQAVHLFH